MILPSWHAWFCVGALLLWASGCKDEVTKPVARQAPTHASPAGAEQTPTAQPATASSTDNAKLCEHKVPADLCAKCNPELAEVFKEKGDWCNEHGVPESQCFACNPKLSFTEKPTSGSAEPWCSEHGVPEAKCTKCKPQLIAKFIEASDYCREHGLPESVCPYCHPELVKAAGHELPVFPTPGTKIRLASPDTEREAGIQTIKLAKRRFARTVDVVGQLHFNENRLAKLSARGDALVVEVKVDIGDNVRRGQALVVLASGGVGQDQSRLVAAKARLQAARAALSREQSLLDSGISTKKSVEQAQTEMAASLGEYDAARASLRAVGAGEGTVGGHYVLSAPFDGTVVARDVAMGKSVSAETPLIEVADLGTMWALLDVPEEIAASVRPEQKVTLTFDGLGGETREGKVGRIGATVDPHTRTVRARVDLPNPDRSLRSGLFVRARVEVAAEHEAILLPKDAIQRAEGRSLVFVRTGPGQYDPVPVDVGARTDNEVEITKGLETGLEIVTTGAFLLKTEILKDSIGAGCADD